VRRRRPHCAFSQGNPKRRFDRLARRLLREPAEFTDPTTGETFVVTYNDLIGATLGVLYDPAAWPDWAVVLQALDEQTRPAAAAASLRALRARLGAAFQQEDYPNFVEGFPGVSCFASACVDAHVSRYFLTSRVPPKGTVCEPDVVPFAQPAAATQAQQATGASAKAELIPPMLRRMLTD
jgi:hypothetical protein